MMTDKNASYSEIKEFIAEGSNILITAHIAPDGDAIGSVLAMEDMLGQLGVRSTIVIDDQLPERYQFLKGFEKISHPDNVDIRHKFEKVIVLDSGTMQRIGKVNNLLSSNAKILAIDHHITKDYYGDVNLIRVDAAATCEILYDICVALNLDISDQIAYAVFVGILTDTGRFRFSNVTEHSYEICAEMIRRGVNGNWVNEAIYFNIPHLSMQTLGFVLNNIELYFDGLVVMMFLPQDKLKNEIEGLVEYGTTIKGVGLSVLISEHSDVKSKVSLRSRCRIDVREIANKFGGGGHQKAAGFTWNGEYKDIKRRLIEELAIQVRDANLTSEDMLFDKIPEI